MEGGGVGGQLLCDRHWRSCVQVAWRYHGRQKPQTPRFKIYHMMVLLHWWWKVGVGRGVIQLGSNAVCTKGFQWSDTIASDCRQSICGFEHLL